MVFSEPYYTSGLIVMVKKDDDTIKGFSDLEGKRIAVQIGTTGANKAGEVKNAKVTAFNDQYCCCYGTEKRRCRCCN